VITALGVVALVAVIVVVMKTVEKYENEALVPPNLNQVKSIPQAQPKTAPEIVETQAELLGNSAKIPDNAKQPAENQLPPPKPEPTAEAKPQPQPKVQPAPKPQAKPLPVVKVPPKPKKPAGPHEVILEALDNLEVTFRMDGGAWQRVSLKPEEIRTIKSNKSLDIKINDGGAVNVIYNGRDKGVPGDLGKSISLRYPK